jgi:hypothetical protein
MMKDDELSSFLSTFANNDYIRQLSAIIESSPRFQAFVRTNSKKICDKIRNAAKDKADLDEKLSDVCFEIFAANIFLRQNFVSEVFFEKYGTKHGSAPDYTVLCHTGLPFNVDVKRIREPPLEKQFEDWEGKIKQFVRTIESPFAIKLLLLSGKQGSPSLNYESDLVNRLKNHLDDIKTSIKHILQEKWKSVAVDGVGEFLICDFVGELLAEISRPSGKKDPQTSWNGTARPVFYKQGEYLDKGEYSQFSNLIGGLKPLKQMRVGMVNLLMVISASQTHEEVDLDSAVSSILALLRERNEDFFKGRKFSDTEDFSHYFENLSGVIFKSIYSPSAALWCNEYAANPIPDYLREELRKM